MRSESGAELGQGGGGGRRGGGSGRGSQEAQRGSTRGAHRTLTGVLGQPGSDADLQHFVTGL